MDGLSNSDVALLSQNDGFGGGAAFFWIFALLILAGGLGGVGGGRGTDLSTQMQAGFDNQLTQSQLQQIAMSSANNNYETARLITQQTSDLMNQNNTNLINAIQGFNQVSQTIAAQGAAIQQSLAQLGYHMDQCCCEIKTQMLQDRLTSTQADLVAAQNAISNANQSQYILGQLGRFVAWTPSGTQAATTAG